RGSVDHLVVERMRGEDGDQRLALAKAGRLSSTGTADQTLYRFRSEISERLHRRGSQRMLDPLRCVGTEERRRIGGSIRLLPAFAHALRHERCGPAPEDLLLLETEQLAARGE